MRWVKDPKVEHHLRSLNIKFDTAQVRIDEIDLKLSADKQTRLGRNKVNDDWVLEYAQAMQAGSPFPMCILNKLKKGYFIWSGVHRVHAADLNEEKLIDAYVVDVTDPRLSDILPRVVNAWEGHGLSRDEKLLNAKYLIENHSMVTEDAARLLGLKVEWVTTYLRGADVQRRIQEQGVAINGMARSTLIWLSPLADNANVLRETAKLLNDFEVKGDRAKEVIANVRKGETEVQRLAEIERWRKALAPKSRSGQVKVPIRSAVRTRAFDLFGRLDRLLDKFDTLTKLQVVEPQDVQTLENCWARISRKMDRMFAVGGKA
jgi:hypothetical protein